MDLASLCSPNVLVAKSITNHASLIAANLELLHQRAIEASADSSPRSATVLLALRVPWQQRFGFRKRRNNLK